MKQDAETGIWLPDYETHYLQFSRRHKQRFIENYQHDRIDAAMRYVESPEEKTAIDGGANVGLISLKLVQHFSMVHAFEPAGDCYACLVANTVEHDNVRCIQAALGSSGGRACMDQHETDNTGSRQMNPDGEANVDVVAIDDYAMELGLDVGLIKLDIQGYEYFALRGAVETLKRCHPVCVVEVEEAAKLPRMFCDPMKAVRYLETLGAVVRKQVGHDWILSW